MSSSTSAVPPWAGPRRPSAPRRPGAYTGQPPPKLPMRALKGVALTICCLLVVGPFLAVVATSLADAEQVNAAGGLILWPDNPNLNAYRAILAGGIVTRSIVVSVCVTVVGTALSLTFTALLAYSLSRPGSFLSKPMLLTVLFTLLFSPGIIPSYLMVKQLGLLDSYWALILPTMISGFNVIVMRAFFMELPQELLDSARIDGAGEIATFLRIVLPLSKAVLAVVGLFYAVGYWNAFFNALLYLNDNAKWPLQLVLRSYVVNSSSLTPEQLDVSSLPPQQSLQMAILVLSLVPIALIYPFIQRHFTKGVLIGAVKG